MNIIQLVTTILRQFITYSCNAKIKILQLHCTTKTGTTISENSMQCIKVEQAKQET